MLGRIGMTAESRLADRHLISVLSILTDLPRSPFSEPVRDPTVGQEVPVVPAMRNLPNQTMSPKIIAARGKHRTRQLDSSE